MEKTRAKLQSTEPAAPAPISGQKGVHPGYQIANKVGEIDPKHWPKKHPPGSLKRGDSVWYCNQRYWVEFAPSTWDRGCYVRISNEAVHPDPMRPLPTDKPGKNLFSTCVHADALELAPQAKNIYADQPTKAAIVRRERAKVGERDVGDEVAVLLRACKSLDDVYEAGAKFLGMPEKELHTKYDHLNHGQQRMNIGNRMRSKWKKDNGHG